MVDASLADVTRWLAATPLSHTIRNAGWIIPALQTIHILAVAVVFSSAILVNLRVWGVLQRQVPIADVARRFLPVIWLVLLVLVVTGGLLIVGEPRRELMNSTFYLKMALLAVAIVLTVGLQWSLAATPQAWQSRFAARIAIRVAAGLSIIVWCGIIFAGRWIAYTQV
jgi:hypothetical protein